MPSTITFAPGKKSPDPASVTLPLISAANVNCIRENKIITFLTVFTLISTPSFIFTKCKCSIDFVRFVLGPNESNVHNLVEK